MKMFTKFCVGVALVGACVTPLTAAASQSQMDKAVALAAPSSKAQIGDISMAVYRAVKADPDCAVAVYEAVLNQRKDWTAVQVYSITRAVLLARPDLEQDVQALVRSGKFVRKNPDGSSVTVQAIRRGGKSVLEDIMPDMPEGDLGDLLTVLYYSELPPTVVDEVITYLITPPYDVYNPPGTDINTNPPGGYPPTPPPTSRS